MKLKVKKITSSKFAFALSFLICFSTFSQLPPRTPSPFDVKQLHCGHSLTSPLFGPWPGQYVELVADENSLAGWQIMDVMIGNATLPGAWLTMHWNQETAPCAPDCYLDGANPRYDINDWELMVITENFEGPANNSLNNSRENLSLFVNNTWAIGNSGNGAPTMLWTNWPGIDGSDYFFDGYGITEATDGSASGWRQMLDFLENQGVGGNSGWQAMQDYANDNKPSDCPPVYIIPGNRMMARFYDDVEASLVPTITHVNQIFTDGVHTNNIGAYMVSMIHYACIFGTNPVGLSNNLHPDVTIDPALATYIQTMVWDVVTNYPRSGIVGELSANELSNENYLEVYPNPAKDILNIQTSDELINAEIYTSIGQLLVQSNDKIIDVSSLESGCYTLKVNGKIRRFIVH